MDPLLLVALAVLLGLCLSGIRIIREHERGVIFRLGRFFRAAEPGLRWITPGIDRMVAVEITAVVPDWRSLGRDEIEARLRVLAENGIIQAH